MYDIIVVENLRFRPSTRKREANVCKNFHLGERFRKKHAFSRAVFAGYVATVGQTGGKIYPFTNKHGHVWTKLLFQLGDKAQN